MGKLDLHIGSVNENNDGLIGGAIEDTTNGLKNSVSAVINTPTSAINMGVENIVQTIRHPWQTVFNKSNWGKLVRTVPVVGIDLLNKAKSLPFRTLDLGIQYLINNNLERIVGASKSATTGALANFITSNGETNWKVNKILGAGVEGILDLAGSLVKLPTGLIGLGANKANKYVGNLGLETTDKWLQNLRLSDKDFYSGPVFNNTAYKHTEFKDVNFGKSANNTNYTKEEKAA